MPTLRPWQKRRRSELIRMLYRPLIWLYRAVGAALEPQDSLLIELAEVL